MLQHDETTTDVIAVTSDGPRIHASDGARQGRSLRRRLGLQFWIDVYDAVLVLAGLNRGNAWIAIPVQLVGLALAYVCFRRGRKLAGLFGLFVPLVALIGAVAPQRERASSSA